MNGCPCKENSVIQEGKPQDGGIVAGKFMQLLQKISLTLAQDSHFPLVSCLQK